MQVYLDNAATTKIHPRVIEKMMPYLTNYYGNPSSIHSFGRKTRVAIEESRELIADFINAYPSEIYFTSCGTEATNFVINGITQSEKEEFGKDHIITSSGDHKATLQSIHNLESKGFNSTLIQLKKDFSLETKNKKDLFNKNTSLLSVVHVNNEIGSINKIEDLANINENFYTHTDAVQSFGKIKIDVKELGIHSLSASAHKLYGPKGIGLAYIKSETPMHSFILGGGQERNRRAGTENVAFIVGFAEAVKIASESLEENFEKVSSLRNYFKENLKKVVEGIFFNESQNNSPYILNFTLDPEIYNCDSEAILMFLDINGIAASSGSACASGTIKPSHVILAGGYSEDYAKGTLRFSFSSSNTKSELDYTTKVIEDLSKKIKRV